MLVDIRPDLRVGVVPQPHDNFSQGWRFFKIDVGGTQVEVDSVLVLETYETRAKNWINRVYEKTPHLLTIEPVLQLVTHPMIAAEAKNQGIPFTVANNEVFMTLLLNQTEDLNPGISSLDVLALGANAETIRSMVYGPKPKDASPVVETPFLPGFIAAFGRTLLTQTMTFREALLEAKDDYSAEGIKSAMRQITPALSLANKDYYSLIWETSMYQVMSGGYIRMPKKK